MTIENEIEKIKSLLIPFESRDLKRYGGSSDGGYVLSESLTNESKIIYSLGVGPGMSWISFDLEMELLGKEVYLYDGFIDPFWGVRKSFHFKKENITSDNFNKLAFSNGHENETNILLKMDIEGWEYDSILNCDDSIFKHFSQFAVEVHDILHFSNGVEYGINKDIWSKNGRSDDKIAFFEKINKYYNLVHIHGNNCSMPDLGIADVLELTYIRKDKMENNPPLSKKACPSALDYRNCIKVPEIPMNWWIN